MPWTASLSDLSAGDRDAFGAKAAGLGEMMRLGLPVPSGFAVATAACRAYLSNWTSAVPRALAPDLIADVRERIRELEAHTGARLGGEPPLLVSVRSGAAVSMPGMMDSVLNVGLTAEAYGRLQDSLGGTAVGELLERLRQTFREATAAPPPEAAEEQLFEAIRAVFHSWRSPRAARYREQYSISDEPGTGVVVQQMVLGNRDGSSASGVVFSRDPSTGSRGLAGEFVLRRQGEDVVAGQVTPEPLSNLQTLMPRAALELDQHARRLEGHFQQVQDIEFTIESGRLWLLQTRAAKLSARAKIVCAVEMADEGLVSPELCLDRVGVEDVRAVRRPALPAEVAELAFVRGRPAAPGAACGAIALSTEEALEMADDRAVVLVRPETTPGDLAGMIAASAIVTARGGATSHAAVVARELGVPCVVGCEELQVDEAAGVLAAGGRVLHRGDPLTVDGDRGLAVAGLVDLIAGEPPPQIEQLRSLAEGSGSAHARSILRALA